MSSFVLNVFQRSFVRDNTRCCIFWNCTKHKQIKNTIVIRLLLSLCAKRFFFQTFIRYFDDDVLSSSLKIKIRRRLAECPAQAKGGLLGNRGGLLSTVCGRCRDCPQNIREPDVHLTSVLSGERVDHDSE